MTDKTIEAVALAIRLSMRKGSSFDDAATAAIAAYTQAVAGEAVAELTLDQFGDEIRATVCHFKKTIKVDTLPATVLLFAAPPAPQIPAGYKLVPIEPTLEMLKAGAPHTEGNSSLPYSLYRAMIEAAPEAP